jgi:hypothetical protein
MLYTSLNRECFMTKPCHIQGIKRPRFLIAVFMLTFLALGAFAPCGMSQAQKEQDNKITNQTPVRRPDNVFGTTTDGIRTGRNPDTGDTVIRITPPEKPRQPDYELPPVLVEPKVEFPYDPNHDSPEKGE